MIVQEVVELSRFQFALTAMYHFLFVPLTLGLAFLLAIMESLYVMTNKQIYKDMTKFWGKLFGINFAIGVTTGLAMEFQFGTNWSYYSHYVGDIFQRNKVRGAFPYQDKIASALGIKCNYFENFLTATIKS